MKSNIITNLSFKQYEKKYKNHKKHLYTFTKQEVLDFDRQAGTIGEHYVLNKRRWALIGDTYYEIPKAPRPMWFKGLSAAGKLATCVIPVGVVGALGGAGYGIYYAISKSNSGIKVLLEGDASELIEPVNFTADTEGNLVGKLKLKEGVKFSQIDLDNSSLLVDGKELTLGTDFTLNKKTGELTIMKSAIKSKNPKIEIKLKKVEKIGISLDPKTKTISVGESFILTATLKGGLTGEIKFAPEKTGIVTLEVSLENPNQCKVCAALISTTETVTITAKCGDYTAECLVTVNPLPTKEVTLTLIAGEGGTVEGSGKKVKPGTEVTAKAIPNTGYTFVRWQDSSSVEVSTDAEYVFKLMENTTLTAIFKQDSTQVKITASSSNPTMGKVEGGGDYVVGTKCSLKATPNSGYKFKCWKENDSEISTNNPLEFEVSTARTIVGVFEEDTSTTFEITLSCDENQGSVVGGGKIDKNTSTTIDAYEKDGYEFEYWTDSNDKKIDSNPYTFRATKNETFTAHFKTSTPTAASDFTFTRIGDTNTCSVKKKTGTTYSGVVTIPSKSDDNLYDVVEIDQSGFSIDSSVEEITKIILPEGIKKIGLCAFRGLRKLRSINIPSSVEQIVTTEDNGAFTMCESLGKITVADGNSYYDSRNNCNAIITKADVPATSTTANTLVAGCKYTDFNKLGETHTIGNRAFDMCYKIKAINLPNSIKHIGKSAFTYCGEVKTLTLNEGLLSIGYNAFSHMGSLTSLIIPKTVNSIGHALFTQNYSLSSITVDSENEYFDSRNNCNAIITKKDVDPYVANTFVCGCDSSTIPNDISVIYEYALAYTTSKTDLVLPDSLTKIGSNAFNHSSFTNAIVPSGVTSIDQAAFSDCYSLQSITINSTNLEIMPQTFCLNCTALTTVSLPEGLKTIDTSAFKKCSKLSNINLPSTLTTIKNTAFYNCDNLTNISIPSSVNYIGKQAFCHEKASEGKGVTSVTFGDANSNWTILSSAPSTLLDVVGTATETNAENLKTTYVNNVWCKNECEILLNGEKKTEISSTDTTTYTVSVNEEEVTEVNISDTNVLFKPGPTSIKTKGVTGECIVFCKTKSGKYGAVTIKVV